MGQAAEHYVLKVRWVKHGNAFKYQFYPGAALEDSQTVVFEVRSHLARLADVCSHVELSGMTVERWLCWQSDSWWDVITFLGFCESG